MKQKSSQIWFMTIKNKSYATEVTISPPDWNPRFELQQSVEYFLWTLIKLILAQCEHLSCSLCVALFAPWQLCSPAGAAAWIIEEWALKSEDWNTSSGFRTLPLVLPYTDLWPTSGVMKKMYMCMFVLLKFSISHQMNYWSVID